MYKMAVLDIDGTLTKKDGSISQTVKQTIRQLVDRNIPVCLCTGRNLKNTLPVARKLGIKTPFMSIDGILMYDPVDKKILYANKVDQLSMRRVLRLAEQNDVYVEVVTADRYYKYFKHEGLHKYLFGDSKFGKLTQIKQYFWSVRFIRSLDRFEQKNHEIYQIVLGGKEARLRQLQDEIKAIDPALDIRDNLWEHYLFINGKNVGKSHGVKMLCRHYGFKTEEVVAIGDEMNDIDMLQEAGMGVAMGNAVPAVKAVADYVTLSNEEDGAAHALVKFFAL